MLADEIRAAIGSDDDVMGLFTHIVKDIDGAQRFAINDDVVAAANQILCSKPSSLVNALPLCRLPHRSMWLEWNGEHPVGLDRDLPPRPNTLVVRKVGCLVRGTKDGQVGSAFWVWQGHDGKMGVGGIGMVFTFQPDGDMSALYAGPRLEPAELNSFSVLRTPSMYGTKHPWGVAVRRDNREAEAILDLARHVGPVPNPWMSDFFTTLISSGKTPDNDPMLREMVQGWHNDVSGEGPFLFAVLMLINSRNAVEHKPADLARLNKARAKNRKPPKYDHVVTRLAISRGARRSGEARGMSREAMRQHLVRGHFKLRRSGVYWWSPFLRGDATRPLKRDHYDTVKD